MLSISRGLRKLGIVSVSVSALMLLGVGAGVSANNHSVHADEATALISKLKKENGGKIETHIDKMTPADKQSAARLERYDRREFYYNMKHNKRFAEAHKDDNMFNHKSNNKVGKDRRHIRKDRKRISRIKLTHKHSKRASLQKQINNLGRAIKKLQHQINHLEHK